MGDAPPLAKNDIAGLSIAERIMGDDQRGALVMLHGWGADSGLLWQLGSRLAAMGYRVYMPDLPGFGGSDAPPVTWSVYDYADFVLAYLETHDLEKVFLFGHSFGGRLGLILGSGHAERVHKMALSNSAGVREQAALSSRLRLGLYKSIRDGLYSAGAKSVADTLRKQYNQRYGSSDFQVLDGVMRQTFVQVVNEDLLPLAAQVSVPTLLFWGDKDEDTPLKHGQLLEKAIPDAGLIVHPGAGHYAYLEHAAETARVMDFFFRQHD